ncbi:hypothetical protein BDFB_008760, partial [Asbolus verrucosus]
PKSPKISKTPPPSPADFITKEQAAAIQAASASPQDDDDSLDTDGFREDQCLLETPTPGEDTSIEGKDYLSNYRAGDIDLEEVTPYDDIRQYYQHQAKLFSGPRKRLASTEDLEVDGSNPSIDNNLPSNRDIARVSLESYRISESDPVLRPGELKIYKGFHSPEEKGAKDSKKPEDWERKERKTVERLHGGGGKDKIPPSEEEFRIKTTPDKKIAVAYTETGDRYNNEDYAKNVSRSTSPLTNKEIAPTPETIPPNLPKTYPTPTLELVIGRKEVRTKEASATAESRLTLYGTNDVEISIKSQSHISVTTTRRDESGVETSETVDVGVTNTTEKRGRPVDKSAYIIPPPAIETIQKKREETVNFSGTKLIYTYDNSVEKDESQDGSLATEDSYSHHVTDTGISLTRGTTETMTSPVAKPPDVLHGLQTTGDTAVDVELEECECTDAGLSPIQADESLPQEPYFEEEVHFVDANTSPIEFPESGSIALSQVDTSEAATLTDQIDTKDASSSPIKPEESPPSISDKLKDEDILKSRRGSGDVKAKVKLLEQTIKSPSHAIKRKKEVIDSEDEISSMKEEDYRGSNETLAQIEDDYDKTEATTVSEDADFKTKHTVSTHTKHVGRKIAELQKIFSGSSDLEDSEEEVKRPPLKAVKIVEKREIIIKEEKPKLEQEVKKVEIATKPFLVDGEPLLNGLDISDKSDEIEVKSVKDKRALFEELISKSQEGTPKKEKTVQQERIYTDKELSECVRKMEEEVVVEPKISHLKKAVTKVAEEEKRPTIPIPVCEPPCEKVVVEHKTPSPLIQESAVESEVVKLEEEEVQQEPILSTEVGKIFRAQTDIIESISGKALEICEEPCTKVTVCKLTPKVQEEPVPDGDLVESPTCDSHIIKEALVAHTKLLSTIALPPQVLEAETVKLDEVISQVDISKELEREIIQQRMKEDLELSKKALQLDTMEKSPRISEKQVQKLMSEVLEATIQIRAEVKELKPDLTPTPEGQLISIISSSSTDHIRDLEQIEEEGQKDDTKQMVDLVNSIEEMNDIDYVH